jgi:hypothetical protein
LKAGLKRWLRYLVLQILVLMAMGGGCFVAVWGLGIINGLLAIFVIVVAVTGIRDVLGSVMRRSINPIFLVKSTLKLVANAPVHVFCGYVVQGTACGMLVLTAMRLQLVATGWWLPAALVAVGAQLLVMGRCVVRSFWLELLIRIDREGASS